METKRIDLLLLRGLAREKRHWGDFSRNLQNSFEEVNVITMDLPGLGTERLRKSPTTIDGITDDLRARWLECRKTENHSFLVAISLGGMVASNWVDRFPSDFQGLVLINSSLRKFSPFWKRLRPHAMWALVKILSKTDNVFERECEILKLTSNVHTYDEGIAQKWASYFKESPMSYRNFFRQFIAAIRCKGLGEIMPPNLVLGSKFDRLCHYSCSEAIAKHFSGKLMLHESAGHDLPLDDPEWVIKNIHNFVLENKG